MYLLSSMNTVTAQPPVEARDFSILRSGQLWGTFSFLFTGNWMLFP